MTEILCSLSRERTTHIKIAMMSAARSVDRTSWRHRQGAVFLKGPDNHAGGDSGPRPRPKFHGKRPYPDWLVHAQIARRRWDDPEVETFLREGEPVVLTGGLPLTRALVGKWTFAYLAEHYSGPAGLNVHFTPRATTQFARFYGEGAGEGGIVGMSFRQFAEVVERNETSSKPPWRHYMQWTLLWSKEDICGKCEQVSGGGTMHGASDELLEHAELGKTLEADLRTLDFEWLAKVCSIAGCDGLSEANLWAGASGGATPLHFDETSNFLCQIRGRKRLLLVSPGQTAKLYPYPISHPAHAFSMVDVEKPDLDKFPSFARVKGLECILGPGDCLFLPSHIWHYVKQWEGDETLSLNFWVGSRRDVRKDRLFAAEKHGAVPSGAQVDEAAAEAAIEVERAAMMQGHGARRGAPDVLDDDDDTWLESGTDGGLLCMQMARHVERELMVSLCGDTSRVGVFLSALSVGADARWACDSTAKGIASQVRSHLITVLGKERAGAVIRGLARDGRLDPGLAPPLGPHVVGTDDAGFSSREELMRWVHSSGEDEKELLRRNLL